MFFHNIPLILRQNKKRPQQSLPIAADAHFRQFLQLRRAPTGNWPHKEKQHKKRSKIYSAYDKAV